MVPSPILASPLEGLHQRPSYVGITTFSCRFTSVMYVIGVGDLCTYTSVSRGLVWVISTINLVLSHDNFLWMQPRIIYFPIMII